MTIADIKANTDILEVILRHGIDVQKRGSYLMACCPLHDEKTPSFVIYQQTQTYHCYGCGVHGDVVDLVAALHHCTTADAVKWFETQTTTAGVFTMPAAPAPRPTAAPTADTPPPVIPFETVYANSVYLTAHFETSFWQLLEQAIANNTAVDYCPNCYIAALDAYAVGTLPNGLAYFPLIQTATAGTAGTFVHNGNEYICTGAKMIRYNGTHRDKNTPPLYVKGTQPKRHYFGAHLAQHRQPDAAVYIVESEKTAIAATAVFNDKDDYNAVFVATGGKGNLTADGVRSLCADVVYLLPDADAVEQWTVTAASITQQAGVKCVVVDWVAAFVDASKAAAVRASKADICDYLCGEV